MARKSQSSIEFMIITAAVLFFFTIFMIIIQNNTSDKNKEKSELILKEIGLTIQDEINLASSASNGYTRQFTLPDNVLGQDYSLTFTAGFVNLKTSTIALSLSIGNFTGNIVQGENIIKKENETVYIN